MPINYTIQKNDFDLLCALGEDLQILKEELLEIPKLLGLRPHRVKILAVLLRMLVCDHSQKDGGLLIGLSIRYGFNGKIVFKDYAYSLMDYLALPVLEARSGSSNAPVELKRTIADTIQKEAQKCGIAHEDTEEKDILSAILDLGKTEKINLRYALFTNYAFNILKFGEAFIKFFHENFKN